MHAPYSDYLVFVDESGDHGMMAGQSTYPILVLVFCLIRKDDYVDRICPAVQRFKMRHFGHDEVVLHEREIRKAEPPFGFLHVAPRRHAFMADLGAMVEASPFRLIACVIRKDGERMKDANPYHLAMRFGLERVQRLLAEEEHGRKRIHVITERRGKREDAELELAFRRIGDECFTDPLDFHFDLVMVDKKSNCTGLQLADLTARPVGTHVLRPEQPNRAWDSLRSKIPADAHGEILGHGLKVV